MSVTIATPHIPKGLPPLEPELLPLVSQHIEHIKQHIEAQPDGFLAFDEFMQLCLYAPEWGYYTGGSVKFAQHLPTGDFTTAPELSPLFGQSLSNQIAQVLTQCQAAGHPPVILEFGAGTGALAESLIISLKAQFPDLHYWILEPSPSLQHRQQQRLSSCGVLVRWLTELPKQFIGCVIANEVLDAMPVHWVQRALTPAENGSHPILELGVRYAPQTTAPVPFELLARPAQKALATIAAERLPDIAGYSSELNLQAEAWIRSLGEWLDFGAALLIDYGFPQHEYYHPQRHEGTLMCHFRHHAHDQPLIHPGLQDITAHVDFTALADAALEAQLEVYGYTSQASFLLNCGIGKHLEALYQQLNTDHHPERMPHWVQTVSASQQLLQESEMGELFKVLMIGRALEPPFLGFLSGDRRDRLAPL